MRYLKPLKNWAEKKSQVIALYVFGSACEGLMHAESDVDIAVLCQGKLPWRVRWAWENELADLVRKSVDLIDLLGVSTVLSFQIVSQGKRIYCQDMGVVNLFETYVYSAYFELNEARYDIIRTVLNRGSVYGR